MITSYARHGSFSRALSLLKRMDLEGEPPNRVTWITILDCCDDLRHGRLLHHELERSLDLSSDADLSCLLIDMYGKCHSLEDACKSFEKSSTTTSVRSWTALIGAFVANGSNRRAIESFHRMALEGVHFDKVAVLSVLEACSGAGDLDRGQLLHRYAVERGWQTDVLVGTAALNMYVKCGRFEQSKLVFDALPEKSLVSWTSMVSSYAGSGRFAEALRAFKLMDLAGLGMDGVALACIFDVCAAFTALSDGSAVYSSVEASGEKLDVTAGAAAINMYGKCGDVSSAAEIFSQYRAWEWSLVLCTTMVAGFARNGHGRRAHELFELIELQGLELDVVSFTTILAACSAAGLLHDGHRYFVSMRGDYALAATMDHYVCVIDLLARSGRVDEGLALLTTMPFEPDGVSWVTVLSSCKTHGDFDVAATLAARVPASEADHPGALVTFFNLIADSSPLLG
ncbi:putative pentatricopeptide repeat-containing protein At1g68930 [Selaginella moellendorffii]|uniref:putative pentatricopeptide repeat-containing protein At1g68930 n=1 Tax=Selaginella moellendorffii TaxID=88036 RepID=UPI000D1C6927|nr:putative pentatricopeptide repeat-containing protein At1g68930 [Selaginella moellendorffii]|eukprot:XP_024544764.1 putative pentatricopeptide repeat-containing protein At1g68930 [Selaginella moellendorffii]